jgi:hypothetical protein
MDRLSFAGFSLSEASQLYARRFEERSRNLALDFTQSRALLVLAENAGVTQQRLSELTAIASPWLVRILDRLEVMGLRIGVLTLPIAGRDLWQSRRKPGRSCRCSGASSANRCARR